MSLYITSDIYRILYIRIGIVSSGMLIFHRLKSAVPRRLRSPQSAPASTSSTDAASSSRTGSFSICSLLLSLSAQKRRRVSRIRLTLRLSVWLMQIFRLSAAHRDEECPLALWTKQQEIFQNRVAPDLRPGLSAAGGTQDPPGSVHPPPSPITTGRRISPAASSPETPWRASAPAAPPKTGTPA